MIKYNLKKIRVVLPRLVTKLSLTEKGKCATFSFQGKIGLALFLDKEIVQIYKSDEPSEVIFSSMFRCNLITTSESENHKIIHLLYNNKLIANIESLEKGRKLRIETGFEVWENGGKSKGGVNCELIS